MDLNADVTPTVPKTTNTGDGAEAPPPSKGPMQLLSDQLEKTVPRLVDPQLEYMRSQHLDPKAPRSTKKLWNFYGAVSASVRDDNFQNMVHDEYVAQLAYDSTTDQPLVELSAVVESVHKSNYPSENGWSQPELRKRRRKGEGQRPHLRRGKGIRA